jgi:uncharacterized protein YjbI with pentapeptide repeats
MPVWSTAGHNQCFTWTEYHESHRVNFASAGLTGARFFQDSICAGSGWTAPCFGADFTGANLQSANLRNFV